MPIINSVFVGSSLLVSIVLNAVFYVFLYLHLCLEIKMNNLTDKLLSSYFDPELKEFHAMICENSKTKDA